MLPSLGPRLWRFVYCLALNYFSRGCLLRSLGCCAWDGCVQKVEGEENQLFGFCSVREALGKLCSYCMSLL